MTDRQKFWLKVALAVTFPVWILPFMACAVVFGVCAYLCVMVWGMVSTIVDPAPRYGCGKRAP